MKIFCGNSIKSCSILRKTITSYQNMTLRADSPTTAARDHGIIITSLGVQIIEETIQIITNKMSTMMIEDPGASI